MAKNGTTPNVLRSQARKRKNKERNRVAELAEANAKGISVLELRQIKFAEVKEIRNYRENRRKVYVPCTQPSGGAGNFQPDLPLWW